ncbi:hypothetical protein [Faecalibaculum rodentium]|uniref:hypothetical protein n=1 Tax=Faecalibaculum rodentium TaxID=1702221 RepID=UPI00260C1563|nr:hypothetical protein [Faecalibaculum rodentium]
MPEKRKRQHIKKRFIDFLSSVSVFAGFIVQDSPSGATAIGIQSGGDPYRSSSAFGEITQQAMVRLQSLPAV